MKILFLHGWHSVPAGVNLVAFRDGEEPTKNSGASLIEVGNDHRLADPEPPSAILRVGEGEEEASE
jgi:hypothetical protein